MHCTCVSEVAPPQGAWLPGQAPLADLDREGLAPMPPVAAGTGAGLILHTKKKGGALVTWGHVQYGGDSSAVAAQLTADVEKVHSTELAFAARQ